MGIALCSTCRLVWNRAGMDGMDGGSEYWGDSGDERTTAYFDVADTLQINDNTIVWHVLAAFILLMAWIFMYRRLLARKGPQLYSASFKKQAATKPSSPEQKLLLSRVGAVLERSSRMKPAAIASLTKQPARLTEYLLLGSLKHAKDRPSLRSLGVTHVINCAPSTCRRHTGPNYYGDTVKYIEVDADDYTGYPLLEKHMDSVLAVIEEARAAGGRCFVHCFAGVNRSATLCVAHLVHTERWKLLSAVEHVHDLRPIVLSNADFVMQLVQLADRQNLG